MARQLKAEWIKARSLRSTWLLVAIGILAVIAQAVSGILSFKHEGPSAQSLNALSGSSFGLIVVTALGVFIAATEYSSGSIVSTYTVTADRARVIVAKATIAAGLAALVGALSVPLARIVAAALFGFGVEGHWDAGLATAVHYGYGIVIGYAGFAVLGVVVGVLARSVAIGVAAAFFVIFMIDGLLGSISFYAEYALSSTSTVLLSPDSHTGRLPGFGGAIALLLIYAAFFVFAAVAIERHRDV